MKFQNFLLIPLSYIYTPFLLSFYLSLLSIPFQKFLKTAFELISFVFLELFRSYEMYYLKNSVSFIYKRIKMFTNKTKIVYCFK